MFGFCESSARNLSPYDLSILVVRRVMGLVILACLIALIVLATRYLHELVAVVACFILVLGIIWMIHHEKDYATRFIDWCYRRFAQ